MLVIGVSGRRRSGAKRQIFIRKQRFDDPHVPDRAFSRTGSPVVKSNQEFLAVCRRGRFLDRASKRIFRFEILPDTEPSVLLRVPNEWRRSSQPLQSRRGSTRLRRPGFRTVSPSEIIKK
jgi:hypothetical protein